MGMALLKLYGATRDERYLNSAMKMANWVKQYQILNPNEKGFGAMISLIYPQGRKVEVVSAEQTLDCMVLFYYLGKATGNTEYLARSKMIGICYWKSWSYRMVSFSLLRTMHFSFQPA